MESLIGGGAAASASSEAELVRESNTARFAADVIEASREVPVVVDFWAPWCEPCKQVGPAIEKAVRAAGGRVRLVKINIDDNQPLAQQLRIQSIPTVFAFKDGQPVDGFVGAVPESRIKSFIQRLVGDRGPSPADAALEQADAALAGGEHKAASNLYAQVLEAEPDSARAAAGLARAVLGDGDIAGARELLESLAPEVAKTGEVESARAAVELAEQSSAGDGAEIEVLASRLAADDNDHQARFDLAMALFGAGRREAAAGELLDIVRRDRNWNDEAARKQLLKLFEAFGPTDPLTVESRQRLSSILFS
jgi:putative thioredoxin